VTTGASKRLLIVGAGISGLTAAAAFGQRGWDVEVIERKAKVSDAGGVGMTLVANAMRALATIGVADQCVAVGMPAELVKMFRPDGSFVVDNPMPRIGGPEWPGATGITRSDFHAILLEPAEKVATIRCGCTVVRWREDADGVDVELSDGTRARYALLIGADGIYSDTRAMVLPDVRPEPTGQAVWRAEISRPAEVRCTHLFVGGRHGAVGICPVSETKAYAYIVQAHPEGTLREPSTLHEQMRAELDGYGGLAATLAQHIDRPEAVSFRPMEWLLAPKPWGAGRIVFIGDAAHANPPVLAQGAAMGIEDAVVIAEELTASPDEIDQALSRFVERRYPRAAEVVNVSCQLARWEVEHVVNLDVPSVMRRASEFLSQPY
jgi:2-polyprenyl-6-methoxyphenol hydroxylase-like FAD-dependent oxidoreductase